MKRKIREPFTALFLSIVIAGLGHVYAGEWIKGIIFFMATTILNSGLWWYFLFPSTKINYYWFILSVFSLSLLIFCHIDAYRAAERDDTSHGQKTSITPRKRILFAFGLLCVLSVYSVAVMLVENNLYRSFTVPADAMEPTIYKGERVLVDLRAYKYSAPQRGDIVLYKYPLQPNKIFIHRIVGLPGESVQLKDHRVLINKLQLEQDWATQIRHYNAGEFAKKGRSPIIVPADSYYALGDDSARSQDSRFRGCLARSDLIGKVTKRYFPFHRSGHID